MDSIAHNNEITEAENRLAATLHDFMGADVEIYDPLDTDKRGMILRAIVGERMIEITVDINDVTELMAAS